VPGTLRDVCARLALGAPMSSIYGALLPQAPRCRAASAPRLSRACAHAAPAPPSGTIFDVVSTDNPINIAYSNMALDLHQDLPYEHPSLSVFL
jgi:hypothetical protein